MAPHEVEAKKGEHPPFAETDSSGSSNNPATYTHHEYPYTAEHGPPIDNAYNKEMEQEEYEHHHTLLWQKIRHYCRDPFAEFMGTFIMIIFGDGSVAQVLLSTNPKLPKADQDKGQYQSISWG